MNSGEHTLYNRNKICFCVQSVEIVTSTENFPGSGNPSLTSGKRNCKEEEGNKRLVISFIVLEAPSVHTYTKVMPFLICFKLTKLSLTLTVTVTVVSCVQFVVSFCSLVSTLKCVLIITYYVDQSMAMETAEQNTFAGTTPQIVGVYAPCFIKAIVSPG